MALAAPAAPAPELTAELGALATPVAADALPATVVVGVSPAPETAAAPLLAPTPALPNEAGTDAPDDGVSPVEVEASVLASDEPSEAEESVPFVEAPVEGIPALEATVDGA